MTAIAISCVTAGTSVASSAVLVVADQGNTGMSALAKVSTSDKSILNGPRAGETAWETHFYTRQTCLNRKAYVDANYPWLTTTRCSTCPESNGRYWLYVENDCTDRLIATSPRRA